MTEHTTTDRRRTNRPTTDAPDETMATVSHTNPYTGESMGRMFEHGVTIVADGGHDPTREEESESESEPFDDGDDGSEAVDHPDEEAEDEAPEDEVAEDDPDVMADVRHTGIEAANRVFERGGEHPSDRDED